MGRQARHPTKENKKGRQARGQDGRTLGTHHPTHGNKKGGKLRDTLRDELERKETRLSQSKHHPMKGNKKGHNGRQAGRRTQSSKGKQKGREAGRQGLVKVDAPSSKGTHIGGGKMADTTGDKLGTKETKPVGTGRQARKKAWRQGAQGPDRCTCGGTAGDQRRQDLGKTGTPANKEKPKDDKLGDKMEDKRPREGGRTIQQRVAKKKTN